MHRKTSPYAEQAPTTGKARLILLKSSPYAGRALSEYAGRRDKALSRHKRRLPPDGTRTPCPAQPKPFLQSNNSHAAPIVSPFPKIVPQQVMNILACAMKMVDAFSLKFQRINRQNALALYSAKRKTGEKGCIFTALWR